MKNLTKEDTKWFIADGPGLPKFWGDPRRKMAAVTHRKRKKDYTNEPKNKNVPAWHSCDSRTFEKCACVFVF